MGLHYLACLAFLISVGSIIADTSPNGLEAIEFSKRTLFQVAKETGISATRSSSSNSIADVEHTEERTGWLSVPVIRSVKSLFTSSKATPEKLQKWLKSVKSVDTVFKRLHLDKPGNFLFDKPHFAAWVKYADELSAKHPEMSAMSTLTRHYGDKTLFIFIKTAKTHPHTKNIATRLETELMQRWVATRKDPDEVFRLFKLDWVKRDIFEKPEFAAWAKYVEDVNNKHPEEPVWMTPTLTKQFKDDSLVEMIDGAKQSWSESLKAIATKVEDDWIQAGIQNHKTPHQALLDIGLGKTTDNLVRQLMSDKSLVNTWVKYMATFNKRYPEEKTTVVETFTKTFGDFGVATMLRTAKENDWTRNLATKLESEQLKMWLNSGKSTDDVFKQLKLDKARISFRDNPLLSTWVSYMSLFIKENTYKKAVLFSALESRFKDRQLNEILNVAKKFPNMEAIATKMQTDKIQTYLASNASPRNVFTLLGLSDEGDDILGSPLFEIWMKDVKDFNKRNPMQQEAWFDPLRIDHQYGWIQMIDKAMQNPSTVSIGKKVEKEWLNYWLDAKKSPKHVFRWLELDKKNPLTNPRFKTWTTYLDEFNQRYPDQKTTVIDGLRATYNDIGLVRMFLAAKTNSSKKNLVSILEDMLIDKWVVEKSTEAYVRNQIGYVKDSDYLIQRYIKKLTTTTGDTT